MKPINEFRGPTRWLSNFWEAPIEWNGKTYPSTEHAFQAAKTVIEAEHELIRNSATCQESKHNGRRCTLRPDWEDIKAQVMYEVCKAKFTQHPDLGEALLATGSRELREGNTWGDLYWGVDLSTGVGRNQLGEILMRIRDELSPKVAIENNDGEIELSKRTYLPITVTSDCPHCGETLTMDLSSQYLSYPVTNRPFDLRFYHETDEAEHSWTHRVVLRVRLEPVE